MDQIHPDPWRVPERISPRFARWLLVLSAVMLLIAGLGLTLYDGWYRVAYVSAFVLIGLSNTLWAVGSLIPDGPRSLFLRSAMRPAVLLMFVALAVTLGFQFGLLR